MGGNPYASPTYMTVFFLPVKKTPCGPTRINYLFPGLGWPAAGWPPEWNPKIIKKITFLRIGKVQNVQNTLNFLNFPNIQNIQNTPSVPKLHSHLWLRLPARAGPSHSPRKGSTKRSPRSRCPRRTPRRSGHVDLGAAPVPVRQGRTALRPSPPTT